MKIELQFFKGPHDTEPYHTEWRDYPIPPPAGDRVVATGKGSGIARAGDRVVATGKGSGIARPAKWWPDGGVTVKVLESLIEPKEETCCG